MSELWASARKWDNRLLVSALALVALGATFWMGSRIPALNEKAAMGGDTPVSGLSFDIILEVFPGSSIWWELVANTSNWIYTNLYGMSFGVLFGAAALTLLSLVKQRSFEGSFANSALGAVIGAPLGVCVNCAAPIALGLHAGRMRLETTLSALLASPTLNVIVLTMSFSLLPPHLAVLKLVAALTLVLLIVPLLCRFILKEELERTRHQPEAMAKVAIERGLAGWIAKAIAPVDADPRPHAIGEALIWFVKAYARNFFFVFAVTVPLMFLAAILGAIVATFTSPTELSLLLPGRGLVMIVLAIFAVAIIASFVPAPIALDVILTVILLGIGLKEFYAMTMLIALGSFSVYAFIILWRAISLRTGIAVWSAVVALSAASGFAAYVGEPVAKQYYFDQQLTAVKAVDGIDFARPKELPEGRTLADLAPQIAAQRITLTSIAATTSSSRGSKLQVEEFSRRLPTQTAAAKQNDAQGQRFSRLVGHEIGINEEGIISPLREFGYHVKGGGIAAGDIHGDGWVDIVTRRPVLANGLSLYTNVGGVFERQALTLGPVDNAEVFHVALADLDGDSWLDLLVSTVRNGEYLFYNEGGTYSVDNMVQLYEPETAVLASIGFADLDSDGDLDIVAGKWAPRGVSIGWGLNPYHNRNQIYWNKGNREFTREIIPHSQGQTLTLLISDVNGDGILDIIDGDDVGDTDAVNFFGTDGKLAPHDVTRQPFPYMLNSTMGYTEGDWNNDLQTDYYGVQIAVAGGAAGAGSQDKRTLFEICSQFAVDLSWTRTRVRACAEQLLSIDNIFGQKANKLDCFGGIADARDRAVCGSAEIIRSYANRFRTLEPDLKRHAECRSHLEHIPIMRRYCDSLLEPVAKRWTKGQRRDLFKDVVRNSNIMMTGQGEGRFVDDAARLGVRHPGWSWNSRFTDLDQDGWQDLLVMTGIWQRASATTSNMLYHNEKGQFADRTEQFGLDDLTPSYSYVQLDFDRDGDIDVIRDNMSLHMILHRNERPAGPGLWVHLRDALGNSMGIGSRVTICTNGVTQVTVGQCQMRTIHASGGYMSGDPIAAHFGLGDASRVSLIEVRWPNGEISRIEPDQLLGGELVISRQS